MLAHIRDVLSHFGQEVQRIENLEVALGTGEQIVAGGLLTVLPLGLQIYLGCPLASGSPRGDWMSASLVFAPAWLLRIDGRPGGHAGGLRPIAKVIHHLGRGATDRIAGLRSPFSE